MSWRFLRFRTLWNHTITTAAKHYVIVRPTRQQPLRQAGP